MTGQELKDRIRLLHVPLTKVAEFNGWTKQQFNSKLNGSDVKSSVIEDVAKALGVSVGSLYGESGSAVASNNSVAAVNSKVEASPMASRIELLERLLEEKERMIDEKERTIRILLDKGK